MPTSITECPVPCVTVDIADLTVGSGTLTGTGSFDVLVQAAKVHLIKEHTAGRITGSQYAEAYIAMMGQAMQTAAGFTLAKDKIGYEIDQLIKQRELTETELAHIVAQTLLVQAQTVKLSSVDTDLTSEQVLTQIQQTGQIAAQTSMIETQEINAVAEGLNIPKQGAILDEQLLTMEAETRLKDIQGVKLAGPDTDLIEQQIIQSASNITLTEEQIKILEKQQGFQPMR